MLVDQSPGCYDPAQHVFLVYGERMRTKEDKEKVSYTFSFPAPSLLCNVLKNACINVKIFYSITIDIAVAQKIMQKKKKQLCQSSPTWASFYFPF